MKLAAIVPALMAATALYVTSTPASANTTRFACDTAGGRISEFKIPVQASQFRLTGTIQPVVFRDHEDFIPIAAIRLRNPETAHSMTIRLAAANSEAAGANVTYALDNGKGEAIGQVGNLALNYVVSFALVYRQGGQSQIVIGDQVFPVNSDMGSRFDMALGCSTGDFVFDRIGWQVGGAG